MGFNSGFKGLTCFVTQTFFPSFFLLELLYPVSDCAYINIFIPICCLYISLIVDGKKFCSQELNCGM